jgi:signal peptidase I
LGVLALVGYGLLNNRWYHVLAVEGSSMEPTISAGDAIVITRPPERIRPGMVLTMEVRGEVVTHRVIDVRPDGTFETQGDANDAPDHLDPDDVRVVGLYRGRIPQLGRLLSSVQSGGSDVTSAIPATVAVALFALAGANALRSSARPAPTVHVVAGADADATRATGYDGLVLALPDFEPGERASLVVPFHNRTSTAATVTLAARDVHDEEVRCSPAEARAADPSCAPDEAGELSETLRLRVERLDGTALWSGAIDDLAVPAVVAGLAPNDMVDLRLLLEYPASAGNVTMSDRLTAELEFTLVGDDVPFVPGGPSSSPTTTMITTTTTPAAPGPSADDAAPAPSPTVLDAAQDRASGGATAPGPRSAPTPRPGPLGATGRDLGPLTIAGLVLVSAAAAIGAAAGDHPRRRRGRRR